MECRLEVAHRFALYNAVLKQAGRKTIERVNSIENDCRSTLARTQAALRLYSGHLNLGQPSGPVLHFDCDTRALLLLCSKLPSARLPPCGDGSGEIVRCSDATAAAA